MSVVRWSPDVDPSQIDEDQVILVDSDAPAEATAILEIERWCDQYGLRRAPELHPSVVRRDGVTLRRGRCYRPSVGELRRDAQEAKLRDEETRRRLASMSPTTSSVELTRE